MKELPQGWTLASIGDVTGGAEQHHLRPEEQFDYIDISSIDRELKKIVNPQRLTGDKAPSRARQVVKAGDVLVSMTRPNLNAVALVTHEWDGQIASTGFDVLRPIEIESRWLFNLVKTDDFIAAMSARVQGALYPAVRPRDIRGYVIPLAPLNEQKRIADSLDALLTRVDACRERLDRVPQILKRFRQAVLAAATSGALTEGWRSTDSLEWRLYVLADIADIQGGVTKDSKKQQATDEEVPYLRVANVQRGYLDLNEIKTIRIPSSKITSVLLEPGDILFNEGGDIDKLGRGWVWEGQISRCSFQNHVFRARLFDKSYQPKYISWWGNSRGVEYFLRQGKQTTNLASINKTMLSNLPISLPPPEEQQEIVRRVEALFVFADRLEARYTAARAQVENMTPALLAKAFRGELMPQDPNDEPASELLKRIKEQKTNQPEQKRKPQTNTIKKERRMNTKAATTLNELVSALDQLGGDATADRLLIESGLSDDIDRFFELLREGRNTLLDVPVGSNRPIRRIVDANQ